MNPSTIPATNILKVNKHILTFSPIAPYIAKVSSVTLTESSFGLIESNQAISYLSKASKYLLLKKFACLSPAIIQQANIKKLQINEANPISAIYKLNFDVFSKTASPLWLAGLRELA